MDASNDDNTTAVQRLIQFACKLCWFFFGFATYPERMVYNEAPFNRFFNNSSSEGGNVGVSDLLEAEEFDVKIVIVSSRL